MKHCQLKAGSRTGVFAIFLAIVWLVNILVGPSTVEKQEEFVPNSNPDFSLIVHNYSSSSFNYNSNADVALSNDSQLAFLIHPKLGLTVYRRNSARKWKWELEGEILSCKPGYDGLRFTLSGNNEVILAICFAVGSKSKDLPTYVVILWNVDGLTWSKSEHILTRQDTGGFLSIGYAISLSNDGRTAAISGVDDNRETYSRARAVWIFAFDKDGWKQQGNRVTILRPANSADLAPSGYHPHYFIISLALSGDGNTLAIGAAPSNAEGAVLIFQRNIEGEWSQQARLTPRRPGRRVRPGYGASVSLSENGLVCLVGTVGLIDEEAEWTGIGEPKIFEKIAGGEWVERATVIQTAQRGSRSVSLSASGDIGLACRSAICTLLLRNGNEWIEQRSRVLEYIESHNDKARVDFGESVYLLRDASAFIASVQIRFDRDYTEGAEVIHLSSYSFFDKIVSSFGGLFGSNIGKY